MEFEGQHVQCFQATNKGSNNTADQQQKVDCSSYREYHIKYTRGLH